MNEAPGPINFTMFLTMFGEKLNGTDPEDVIRNAFACFDEEGTGERRFLNETDVKISLHHEYTSRVVSLFVIIYPVVLVLHPHFFFFHGTKNCLSSQV